MIRIQAIVMLLAAGISGVILPPVARADTAVVYEVYTTTPAIPTADIVYTDISGTQTLQRVPLPWRVVATVDDPRSPDARVEAAWPGAQAALFVTVRVFYRGSLLCQNTMNVGKAACDGAKTYKS